MKTTIAILILCLGAGCATQKVVTSLMPPVPTYHFNESNLLPLRNDGSMGGQDILPFKVDTNCTPSLKSSLVCLPFKYTSDAHRPWTLEGSSDLKNWSEVSWQVDRDYLLHGTITIYADKPCQFYRVKG